MSATFGFDDRSYKANKQLTIRDRRSPIADRRHGSPVPAPAFSVAPTLGVLDGRSAEQLDATIDMRAGNLKAIGRVCVKVDG